MGCTTSKHHVRNDDSVNRPFVRNMSMPVQTTKSEGGNRKISWKSAPYSMPRYDVAVTIDSPDSARINNPSTQLSVKEEGHAHISEVRKDMQAQLTSSSSYQNRNCRLHAHVASFDSVPIEFAKAGLTDRNIVPSPASAYNNVPYSETASKGSMDGLKVLLSPASMPCHVRSRSLTKGAGLGKSLSSNWTVLGKDDFTCLDRMPSTCERSCLKHEWMPNADDVAEPGSPLFDPSILATIEKALESSSDDNWQSSDGSATSASTSDFSTPDICSDSESPQWSRRTHIVYHEASCIGLNTPLNQSSFSLKEVLHQFDNPLENFDCKCPPGCESKIVLYFTSLRGIRKTYEACCSLRLILKGYDVHVVERDVSMHSSFRQELTDVFGAVINVPRLFIKGRYIGGVEEVKQLHEDGILAKLLEGLPVDSNKCCDVCGDLRFLPCSTCNGSHKLRLSGVKISQCPDCNENGLVLCPMCDL